MTKRAGPVRGYSVGCRWVPTLVATLWAWQSPCQAGAQVVAEPFDSGLNGWSLYRDGTDLTWVADEGNPGGCIRARDAQLQVQFFFNAGPLFLGDKSCYYGGRLSWQQKTDMVNGAGASQPDVLIEGAGLALAMDLDDPAADVWESRTVTLTENAGWRRNSISGGIPTRAEVQSVLASITAIKFRAEFNGNGQPELAWMDNVKLERCAADFNCSHSLSVQDLFDFLAAHFSGNTAADFNQSGVVSVQDLFDFLAAYFAGCP